jgi:uncharacterized repeat protein (TIGR03803 family)
MKDNIQQKRLKNLFFLSSLITALGVKAQTFTTLYSFTAESYNGAINADTNSDGAEPQDGLILSGSTLYGTAFEGGNANDGTVFRVNINRSGFTNLHSFTVNSGSPYYTNSDGGLPFAGLILSGTSLYGIASGGGSSGYGTIFKVSTDGTVFTNLYSFTNGSDGANPRAGLLLSGSTLYGTARGGGTASGGSVFAINTDGTGFTNLHSFNFSNGEGIYPTASLILSGSTLYGTTQDGGSSNHYGTVFGINTNGLGFTTLYNFTGGSDEGYPYAGLILSGGIFYGTTSGGGTSPSGSGTVFAVNTNGSGITNLHSFSAESFNNLFDVDTNSDGAYPEAGLILSGNTLYGAASQGGTSGNGTLFKVNIDGSGFANLHNFTRGNDGGSPLGGLILSSNILYGTAFDGGSSGYGTVFGFSLPAPPQLAIILAGINVILTWPTNDPGFTLQSTTNLSPVNWMAVSPAPVVVKGQNTVTNPISSTQQFYQLIP